MTASLKKYPFLLILCYNNTCLCQLSSKGVILLTKKGWLTPILVFIICISFLLSYQSKQGGSSLAQTTTMPLAPWNIEISNISKITFKESGKQITATLTDNTWTLTEPLETSADSPYIYNILSSFSHPQFIAEVDFNPERLIDYGIDEFSKSITLYDQAGTHYELICGKEASSSTYYVYSSSTKSMYTMHKEHFNHLDSNLSLWRDKDFLHFNAQDTSKIKVYSEGSSYILLPNSQGSFTSDTLSQNQINRIINFLVTVRATTFITDNASPEIIGSYGFNSPHVTISVFDEVGNENTLTLTSPIDGSDESYTMVKGLNSIYTVPCLYINK